MDNIFLLSYGVEEDYRVLCVFHSNAQIYAESFLKENSLSGGPPNEFRLKEILFDRKQRYKFEQQLEYLTTLSRANPDLCLAVMVREHLEWLGYRPITFTDTNVSGAYSVGGYRL